jgi:hypothetical protein
VNGEEFDPTTVIPDGDWIRTSLAASQELTGIISVPMMQRGLLIIATTKTHYWNSKHHTGRGGVQGYPKKIADTYYNDIPREQVTSVFQMVSHWQ